MAGELLLDTGALVSLLDRSQKRHEAFAEFFGEWSRPVVSSEAVLTGATHLLGGRKASRHRRTLLARKPLWTGLRHPVTEDDTRLTQEDTP